ncbi:fused MFS/spermidine synthase [Magnetospirillum sp. UT-4]|uniref:fused MFS/spermidine synthase n=1 Tax=Magnetospirillum sp. UT-4 TaxID=2681467 RepID=UPI00137F1C83|nr:fused MFS/spermidine synthase [Magnetospirillum sp. UT-4]CAA7613393.1 putative S-adenosyl-L-methionine-dependent methyltransferases [Magnetospirillum sp. UT-4]
MDSPAPPSRMLQAGYGAALFLVSAAALVVEIVAGRLIAPYVGMSLYTWTAIISVVLAGLTIGHWIGGRQAEAAADPASARFRLALVLALAALSTLAVLPLIRLAAKPLLEGGLHPVAAIVTLATLLFLPPSLFAGVVSPVLTKLAVDSDRPHAGRVIGRMYALGAAGSILGTLSAGYLFISWIGSTGTILIVTAIYGLLAVLFAVGCRRRLIAVAVAVNAGAGLLVLAGRPVEAFRTPCTVESDYYCLRVADFRPQSGRESAVLVLDHLGHGMNDAAEPRLLYSSYLQFADELARRRFGRDALSAYFIGGGAFTLPRAWSERFGRPHLHVAEIDPAVTRIARDRLWLKPEANGLVVDHRDARVALQSLPRQPQFDVVFGDAFHDIGIPPHLVTAEFHAEIAARLKPGGFYAINVIEARHDPKFLFALLKTLWRDFAAVEVWVDGDEMSQGERVTYLVVASDRPTEVALVRASDFLDRHWLRLRDDQVRARVGEAGVPVLTDDFSPVDRLMAHVLLAPEVGER